MNVGSCFPVREPQRRSPAGGQFPKNLLCEMKGSRSARISEFTHLLRTTDVDFDLPVAPPWFSQPPRGTMDDGIRLSLAALEQVKDRPEVFEQRQRQMCDVEFVA
jgi:hypothetical protein